MKFSKILTATSLAVVMALSLGSLSAQDNAQGNNDRPRRTRDGGPGGPGGDYNPAEMQKRMMERTKEQLEIIDETEWKAVEPLVEKVMAARRETLGGRGFGRGGGFGGTPSPEAEALQKAIEAKAPNAEIKAALVKYVESRKAKQAELDKAQAALRKVLTPRQEAIAALNGLL